MPPGYWIPSSRQSSMPAIRAPVVGLLCTLALHLQPTWCALWKFISRWQRTLRLPLLIHLILRVLLRRLRLVCNLIGGHVNVSQRCSSLRTRNLYFEPLRKNFSSSTTSPPSSRLGGGSLASSQNVPISPIVRSLSSHRNSTCRPIAVKIGLKPFLSPVSASL